MTDLSARDRELLSRWQRDFPLVPRPFARLAEEAGTGEDEIISAVRALTRAGIICRTGAVVRPNTAGASTLAAVAAPAGRLEEIAEIISAQPEVTHNYEREHELNLWFVVTAADRGGVRAALARIHALTGLEVLDLPMLKAYHIDLAFALRGEDGAVVSDCRPERPARAPGLTPFDRRLLAAIEDGLPIEARPYARVARWLGADEGKVRGRLAALLDTGVIRRFGFVVNHRALGYRANAMVVWDIPDALIDEAAATIAREACVTLCYQRPRKPPVWRYNLFCMIHGTSRDVVLAQLAALAEKARAATGLDDIPHAPLFSLRRFKQCGARFSAGLKAGAA